MNEPDTTCTPLTWKEIWHKEIVPSLPRAGLVALKEALETNSPELVQGDTAICGDADGSSGDKVTCACAIGYALWKGKRLKTVRKVIDEFTRLVHRGEHVKFFTWWFDTTPRNLAFHSLLSEVKKDLEGTAQE